MPRAAGRWPRNLAWTGRRAGCWRWTGCRRGLSVQEGVVVVYDGGVLSAAELKAVVLADGELAGFAFTVPGEVASLVTPLLARRIAACLDAVAAGTVAALENGSPAA